MGSIDRTKSRRKSSLGITVTNAEAPNRDNPEHATNLPSSGSGTSIASSRTIGPPPNSNIIKRAVQHTAERLSSSRSSRSNSGSSRLASALRKSNKLAPSKRSGSESSDIEDPVFSLSPPAAPTMFKSTPGLSSGAGSSSHPEPETLAQSHTAFTRPHVEHSLRHGTQTLIQALQAIPWEHSDDEAEGTTSPVEGPLSDVEQDEDDDTAYKMSSSIHTIHRSVETPNNQAGSSPHDPSDYFSRRHHGTKKPHWTPSVVPEEGSTGSASASDGDEEADFEQNSPDEMDNETILEMPLNTNGDGKGKHAPERNGERAATPVRSASPEGLVTFASPGNSGGSPIKAAGGSSVLKVTNHRSMSIATVRLKRRTKLAVKLREVFGVEGINEVVAELPCWLLRSILLQGYMYLTNSHICFFAHMPSREDQILKSGTLGKKASRMKRWAKHWFVLKNDVLSWYHSSTDPYFPHGNVDLRYAISCDPIDDKVFKLRTNQKTLTLSADSTPSRDEWVKAIRKIIFKTQNMGESVKIAIPYSVILDVDRSTAMDFSETIEVKVVDRDHFTMDSYFFAYFHSLPEALAQIHEVVHVYKQTHPPVASAAQPSTSPTLTVPRSSSFASVSDTTLQRSPSAVSRLGAGAGANSPSAGSISLPMEEQHHTTSQSGFSLTSLLRPSVPNLLKRTASPPEITPQDRAQLHQDPAHDYTHVFTADTHASPIPSTPVSISSENTATNRSAHTARLGPEVVQPLHPARYGLTYPPSVPPLPPTIETTPSDYVIPGSTSSSHRTSWSGIVPSWLKAPSRRLFSGSGGPNNGGAANSPGHEIPAVVEQLTRPEGSTEEEHRDSELSSSNHLGFSILETPQGSSGQGQDAIIAEKFRKQFALDEKEQLVGYVTGSLFRVLPLSGRMYVSTNYLCFRSSQPLSRTKMMLPLRDILSTERTKAFRFGHHGLIIIIKGHEELFFEFNSEARRDTCVELLERQMNDVQQKPASGDSSQVSQGKQEALILEELDSSSLDDWEARHAPDSESLPTVMFTSTSSTFLSFKPPQPLNFTCLTIGSRGDVQPYIALCKGLKADGHRVKIATHIEYKDWIEEHGIEFGLVGGDPAELMRICVENGTFTVAFLREGLLKFRGWVDDLLKTSWEACQGSDVLIECPSAMGGIHIAEALGIPYFRAFTMPWTRTRAYPHAFAVPERKMGGSYNYMTYVMFDQVFWRATAGQINRWRRNVLGLESTNLDKMAQDKVPFLYNFSPTIVPAPLDWYEWIRVTGFWFLDDASDTTKKKWTPPADLVAFIDNAHTVGKPVVYIGFGSIVVSDPDAMTRCVVDAIVQSGVHAILSKGWSDRLSTKKGHHPEGDNASLPVPPLPPQIYSIQSVPHDWLFPRVDAACHHGGAGTTGASVRAGVPTIIKPFFGDQFFWADRVEALGIGCSVRKLTVDNLAEALRLATTDQKRIARAKVVGERIRAEAGVKNAVEAIYRDLEYARTLIKHRSGPGHEKSKETDHEKTAIASPRSSFASASGSTEWSVISGDENGGGMSRHSSTSGRDRLNIDRHAHSSPTSKRSSRVMGFSAIQDALSIHRTGSRRLHGGAVNYRSDEGDA